MALYRPYTKQLDFHAAGAEYRERLFMCGNQLGKQARMSTVIMTPEGPTTFAKIRVGDRALGRDGYPCTVLGVYPQGVKSYFRLTFDDGSATTDCGPEHLWIVQWPNDRFPHRWSRGKKTPNPHFQRWSVATLQEILDRVGAEPSPRRRVIIPVCEPVEFDSAGRLPLDPYLVGALIGDGCISGKNLSFSSMDREIIERVRESLPEPTEIVHCGDPDRPASWRFRAYQGMAQALSEMGLLGCHSWEKSIPTIYQIQPVKSRIDLLRGLMDTDGTIAASGGAMEYSTTSGQLAKEVQWLVESLGGRCKIKQRTTQYTYQGEKKDGRLSYRCIVKLQNINPFYVTRKADRWYPVNRTPHRVLRKFEKIGEDEMCCIAVDSPDHTYLTDHFIVTHNTLAGGMELAFHLTGIYPKWWPGKRFHGPTKWWASNTNNETVRDNPQRILMGQGQNWGTGTIPGEMIVTQTMARGFPNLIDTVSIRHATGGMSHLQFKAYEQGRPKWQGETLSGGIWFDEEPDSEIYSEGITRLAPGAISLFTATPLLGMSDVVSEFYPHPESPDRHLTMMTIEDAGHYTQAEREQRIAGYPPHEREARSQGIPMLGSGRVFPVAKEQIVEEALAEIPAHWPRLNGLDFGWDHPFAAVHGAWDRDADCVHIVHCYRERHAQPPIHAAAVKPWGEWVRSAWPHDGHQVKGEGIEHAEQYRKAGLKMLPTHATFHSGGYHVEPGLIEMLTRMETGRLRVASHLGDWLGEFQSYHRKDGKIVKERDDLMDATRVLLMSLRYARTNTRPRQAATVGMDYEPLAAIQ